MPRFGIVSCRGREARGRFGLRGRERAGEAREGGPRGGEEEAAGRRRLRAGVGEGHRGPRRGDPAAGGARRRVRRYTMARAEMFTSKWLIS